MSRTSVDVAILGGGMAGNLLARQLRRQVPDASVLMVDKATEPHWKVGESTVEICAHYLVARQKLGTYLYDRHLPKLGLRFFFDTEAKDAELTAMSEIGTDRPPPTVSFQIDRARFEADLHEMNAADGVDLRLGWTVRDVTLSEGGAPHEVKLRGPDREETVAARWVVDGTGRASLIAREKDLRGEVTDHKKAAVWGRFRGVLDVDAIDDAPWRDRVRWVQRSLSTIHFLYRGYWMWFIPLGSGVTSVGVVGEKDVFRRGMRTEEGFLGFLNEHRAPATMIEKADLLDIDGLTQLAYRTERFFDGDRWMLLGDAAAFTDPFYSPGGDFISLECDYATELVSKDLGGGTFEEVADLAKTYDAFMKYRWEATMPLYRDLYRCFGSHDLMRVKLNFDLGNYYNLWLDPFVRGKHLEPSWVMGELRRAPDTMQALAKFSELFRRVEADLQSRGAYHAGNLGNYSRGVDCLRSWIDEVGTPRKKRAINRRTEEVFNYGRTQALKLLGGPNVPADEEAWRLYQFAGPSPLV